MADSSTLLIPHLPDDLSLQCIARIPRSSHPSLLLVSRSWCSLLRSRRLFALRAQLGVTDPSLCVNICTQSGESQWYFLNLRPCRLLPVPPPPFPTFGVGCAVIGSSLYVLGGFHDYIPSSAIQIFDPCLNRWTTAPPMAEPRKFPVVSAVNGRIYVFGGCVSPQSIPWYEEFDPESGAWAEVLDPATGAWASLPRRPTHLQKVLVHRNGVFRGQVLLGEDLLFDPEAAQPWGTVPKALNYGWAGQAVLLDGVLYTYNFMGKLAGHDHAAGVWKPVEGVEGELTEHMHYSKLTNLGGLLCLLWQQNIKNEEDRERRTRGISGIQVITPDMNVQSEIYCVGVEITRTSSGGFRGSIAWRELVAMPISDGWVTNSVVLEF